MGEGKSSPLNTTNGAGAGCRDMVASVDESPDQGWFEVRQFPHAVTMIREPHHREDVKSYLIEGSRDVAVLDTGTGAGDFVGLVASLSSRRPRVLQTHAG